MPRLEVYGLQTWAFQLNLKGNYINCLKETAQSVLNIFRAISKIPSIGLNERL